MYGLVDVVVAAVTLAIYDSDVEESSFIVYLYHCLFR